MHPIYRMTSIGRPVDPAVSTNRAVLLLMPFGAVAAVLLALSGGRGGWALLIAAVVGLLVTFGSWALARELAPDDQPAAFVAMALAMSTLINIPSPGLLLLFLAIGMARIVNRSTGLAPRPHDAIAVTIIAVWAMFAYSSPWVCGVAALAFALDAYLPRGERLHWLFAGVCFMAGTVFVAINGPGLDGLPVSRHGLLLPGLFGAGFLLTLLVTRSVTSVADVGGTPLSPARVRGGMWVVLLLALQNLAQGSPLASKGVVIWAVLGGVAIGRVVSLARARAATG